MPPATTDEAETLIRDWYRRVTSAAGDDAPPRDLRIVPKLDPTESEDFVGGYHEGLFSIDESGYARSVLLPTPAAGNGRQKVFQLFWHRKGDRRILFREGVCQLAAASALVRRYGWPREQVRLEPDGADLPGNAYSVDLIVRGSVGGGPLIFGEVKRDPRSLERLMEDFRACCGLGSRDLAECKRAQHRKFRACWDHQATVRYFWAVCPGVREAYELRSAGDALSVRRLSDLPRFAA